MAASFLFGAAFFGQSSRKAVSRCFRSRTGRGREAWPKKLLRFALRICSFSNNQFKVQDTQVMRVVFGAMRGLSQARW